MIASAAMALLYDSVSGRLPGMNLAAFESAIVSRNFEVVPLQMRGEVVGAVMLRGNEIHVGYGSRPTASIRRHIRQTLARVLEEYGYAVTSVETDNDAGLRFCSRLGFSRVAEIDGLVHMRCERLKHV